MRDFAATNVHPVPAAESVKAPAAAIADARKSFANRPLNFEVMLEADAPAPAFDLCARLARAGVPVVHSGYRENGNLFLKLRDKSDLDVTAFCALFDDASGVKLLRWTTVIGHDGTGR